MRRAALAGVLSCVSLAGVPARGATSPPLVVEAARAIASIPGSDASVIYLTVRNGGAQADRLIAAATPAAGMVHLHAGQMKGGVSSMRPSEGFTVPAHGLLQLRVGGDHLMLMGLPRALQAGTTLALTLTFENAGDLKVAVPVVAMTGN
jgi:copper(I)-binding protein